MNLDSLLPNLGEWLRGTGPESDVVQEQFVQEEGADVVVLQMLPEIGADLGDRLHEGLGGVDLGAVGQDRRVGGEKDRVAAADTEEAGVAEFHGGTKAAGRRVNFDIIGGTTGRGSDLRRSQVHVPSSKAPTARPS